MVRHDEVRPAAYEEPSASILHIVYDFQVGDLAGEHLRGRGQHLVAYDAEDVLAQDPQEGIGGHPQLVAYKQLGVAGICAALVADDHIERLVRSVRRLSFLCPRITPAGPDGNYIQAWINSPFG